MKPYYEHAGVTIYHGDCREVLPLIQADVLVTDPPYGVNLGDGDDRPGHGLAMAGYASYRDTYEAFCSEVVPALNAALDACKRGAVWTGPHIHEQRKPDAIGGVFCPSATGRHGWGFKSFLPVLFYGTAPGLQKGSKATAIQSTEVAERKGNPHPVPKPLGWMRWLVSLAVEQGESIIDPFMGSGTTLVAAKELGRRAIGIEIEERYCEVAAKRLSQEVLFGVAQAAPSPALCRHYYGEAGGYCFSAADVIGERCRTHR